MKVTVLTVHHCGKQLVILNFLLYYVRKFVFIVVLAVITGYRGY